MKKITAIILTCLIAIFLTACNKTEQQIKTDYSIEEAQESINESIEIQNNDSRDIEKIEKCSFQDSAYIKNSYEAHMYDNKTKVLIRYSKQAGDNWIKNISYTTPYKDGRANISYLPYKIAIIKLLQPELDSGSASALAKKLTPLDKSGTPLDKGKDVYMGEGGTQVRYTAVIKDEILYFIAEIIEP